MFEIQVVMPEKSRNVTPEFRATEPYAYTCITRLERGNLEGVLCVPAERVREGKKRERRGGLPDG